MCECVCMWKPVWMLTRVEQIVNAAHTHGGSKTGLPFKFETPVNVDIKLRSIYQTVQYFVRSKISVLYIIVFKYSLRNFNVTTLRLK